MNKKPSSPTTWILVVLLVATWALLFALRIVAPSDYMDNDQQRPAAYLMDILVNNAWIVQTDDTGDIASKPPLHTWLMALTALALGGANLFVLMVPGALATLGTALLIFFFGRRYFGYKAAFLAAAMSLLSMTGIRQIGLIRSDAVFSLLTFSCLLLLFFCMRRKANWIWFWLLAALATLTKGPLALILAGGGLFGFLWTVAPPWQRNFGGEEERRTVLKQQAIGIVLFIIVTAGWFLLALWSEGQPVIDKLIGKELVGQAVARENKSLLGNPHRPALFLLSRFAPWSILFFFAVYRVIFHPAEKPGIRLAERCLLAYSLFGIVIFSVAAHQRPDHLLPLVPAAALLAGRELTRWIRLPFDRRGLALYASLVALFLIGFGYYYILVRPLDRDVRRTAYVQDFSEHIASRVGENFPFIHADGEDNRYSVQFFMGTMLQRVGKEQVATALRSPLPAYVVTLGGYDLQREMSDMGIKTHIVEWWPSLENQMSWPARYALSRDSFEYTYLQIVSNREKLEQTDRFITFADGISIRASGMRVEEMKGREIHLRQVRPDGKFTLRNLTSATQRFTVSVNGRSETRQLSPDEAWSLSP